MGSGFPWILHGKWTLLPLSTFTSTIDFCEDFGAMFRDASVDDEEEIKTEGREEETFE